MDRAEGAERVPRRRSSWARPLAELCHKRRLLTAEPSGPRWHKAPRAHGADEGANPVVARAFGRHGHNVLDTASVRDTHMELLHGRATRRIGPSHDIEHRPPC